jgi:hypothetical protein
VFGTIFTKSNSATDLWAAPRKQTVDTAAADTGSYDYIPINGQLTINVAQADALTNCVISHIRWAAP